MWVKNQSTGWEICHDCAMGALRKRRRLLDGYAFPGFPPLATVQGMFGDSRARLITLVRRGKKLSAARAGRCIGATTTARADEFAICRAANCASGSIWKCGVHSAAVATRVKRERLEFLVERTRHTRRFARYVGRRCVSSTIKDVAEELLLGWDAVKLPSDYAQAFAQVLENLHGFRLSPA